jgi:hypothetical protein
VRIACVLAPPERGHGTHTHIGGDLARPQLPPWLGPQDGSACKASARLARSGRHARVRSAPHAAAVAQLARQVPLPMSVGQLVETAAELRAKRSAAFTRHPERRRFEGCGARIGRGPQGPFDKTPGSSSARTALRRRLPHPRSPCWRAVRGITHPSRVGCWPPPQTALHPQALGSLARAGVRHPQPSRAPPGSEGRSDPRRPGPSHQ